MGDSVRKDSRFDHIPNDPRFRRIPKAERKVKIDKRFQSMFDDGKFKLKYTVDKRGRPINHTTNEDLRRFYDLSSEESGSDSSGDDNEDKSDLELNVEAKPTSSIPHVKKQDKTSTKGKGSSTNKSESIEVQGKKGLLKKTEVPGLSTDIVEKLHDTKIDYARGEGVLLSDSSSDESSDEGSTMARGIHQVLTNNGLSPDTHGQYCGTIDGEKRYNLFIDDLMSVGMAFAVNKTCLATKSDNIKFRLTSKTMKVEYDGKPIHFTHTKYLNCTLGGRYKKNAEQSNDNSIKKKKNRARPSKKVKCPATMTVKCFTVFTQDHYKAKAPSYEKGSREMSKIVKQLKTDLASSSPPTGIMRYMIAISPPEEHNHKTITTKLNGIIHPQLREEIHNFVHHNILCSTKAMKIHLEEVVRHMFNDGDRPKPDKMNHSYYPTDDVIRFQMQKARDKIKQHKYYQDTWEASIEIWQSEFPDDKFEFRPHSVEVENEEDEAPTCSTLLFCHQTKWQQDLLARYGNDISLLDATYKTTKYDHPLFFIVVKTNSGYCVVGTFVVQSEHSTLIAEALSQFKAWNPNWNPKYFMTDFSEAEINALEETFYDSIIYFCAFHREQSWHRWLTTTGNVCKDTIVPLKKLWCDIAASETEEELAQNLERMYDDPFYQNNQNAQQYFTREWLPVKHRWICAYYDEDFLSKLTINNGVESQNKIFQHSYLKQNKDSTLTGVIGMLIHFFLKEMLTKYIEANTVLDSRPTSTYKKYNDYFPQFLKNRPMSFSKHVWERYTKGQEYDSSHICDIGDGLFLVRSELQSDEWYNVNFQQATCSCSDFKRWRFPCKHMCAIFILTEWGFDKLPQEYRENPYLTVDTKYTAESAALNEDVEFTSTEKVALSPPPSPPTEETVFNMKRARLELQESLKRMMGYSYLNITPENLKKMLDSTKQLEQSMQSVVATSNEGLMLGPTEENVRKCTQVQQVKTIKNKYTDLPKCIRHKNKNKYVGRVGANADGWKQSATTNLDLSPETCQNNVPVVIEFLMY